MCGVVGGALLAAVACSSKSGEADATGGTGALPTSGGAGGSAPSSGGKVTGSGGSTGGSGGSTPMMGGTGGGPSTGGMPGGGTGASSGGMAPTDGGEAGVGSDAGGVGPDVGGQGGGGSAGKGGSGPLGDGLTDVGTFTPATCTTAPEVTTAAKIPMVGIATFTTDLAGAERAVIQFGTSSAYTLEAPVNWDAEAHRTLILGMPASTEVHYRVVVFAGSSACVGPDETFTTGSATDAPANQPPSKGTSTASVAPGFMIVESQTAATIVNKKGEVVWFYRFPIGLSRALMSWDGHYLYGREVGPFNAPSGGAIYRVAMDGSGELKLPVTGGTHHDLVAIPTGIAYPAKQQAGACDCIFTAAADGSGSACLVDMDVVFSKFNPGPGGASMDRCHVNAIRYYADTKSYSVSDREKDAIAFFSETGELLGSIGATPASETPNHVKAEGADSTTSSPWRVQHGHDLYEPNKLILWSNGNFMGGVSRILHYTIDGDTASLDWQYTGTGTAPTLSDAQHLPNGNFLATNSSTGGVHEVDATGELVQSFAALSRGYSSHRATLYGPPPGR